MLKKQLRRDEGVVSHVYLDHLGYQTIGVGFLVDKRRGGGIPDDVIDFWLDYEIEQRRNALKTMLPFFNALDAARQDALINMAYQLGVNGLLNFKRTLHYMQRGDYELAAKEALNSNWAKQTPERAARIAKQIKTGVYQ